MTDEKDDELSAKQKSPRSRSKSISSRSKDKQPVRAPQATSARPSPRSKGKCKVSIFPPAATYDEIALPAPEPTAAKSDATDFSVLSDVLRQEKMDQAKMDVFQVGSDDSTEEEAGLRPDSAIGSGDILDDGDEGMSDGSDVDGEGDGDSDEAMSVDSYAESDGDVDGESEVEGDGSSQESEDSLPKAAWIREEDRVILQCFQAAGGDDDSVTFGKISELLPSRTLDEVSKDLPCLRIETMRAN